MLIRRILSAVFLVLPIIAALVFAPSPWAVVTAFVLYLIAAWEWSGFFRYKSLWYRLSVLAVYAGIMALLVLAPAAVGTMQWLLALSLGWWLVAFIWIMRFPTRIPDALTAICGMLIVVPPFVVILLSRSAAISELLIFVFVVVWAADIGAYFVGRAFGRHKLAPQVSPGKTWEGFAGGMIAAMLGAFVFALVTQATSPYALMILALTGAMGSVVGDLTVSMFKRHSGVKDSGVVFPGHGGVLDRFDSFSAAAPVVFALHFMLGQGWV